MIDNRETSDLQPERDGGGGIDRPTTATGTVDVEPATVEGEIIIKFGADVSAEEIEAIRSQMGGERLETTQTLGIELWRLPVDAVEAALSAPTEDPRIEYITPNRVYQVERTVPNDPDFGQQWALDNAGQTGGQDDTDIDAPEAWDQRTDSDVVVGIIDTGIDYTHPDLAANIWVNPGEIADNGIDDDGNGFVDDVHGYDFVNEDNDPQDDYSHGTHVAGTIGAVGNNGVGVSGVAWNASLMAIKAFDSGGSGNEFDIVQAIEYSVLLGVGVTNNSWGGGGESQAIYDAIAHANEHGQLFVAAAGNDSSDTDGSPHYPSNYDLDNIISVAAINASGGLAWFSNYGAVTVDLGAPGEDIYSTLPGGGYGSNSGTSMATPHVTGVAALMLAEQPGLSASDLKDALLASVQPLASLAGITVSGGQLNAAEALAALGPPNEITGTDGIDVLSGTARRDLIHGLGGDDLIQGLGSDDQLHGDDGRDLISGGDRNDTIDGGHDDDVLLGDAGDDSIMGDGGNDTIVAGTGNDSVDGGAGRDRILGENGDDVIAGGGSGDLIDGGDGNDSLAGGHGDDSLYGTSGDDVVAGGKGRDVVHGGAGNDSLAGDDGADTVIGDGGNDSLVGGAGKDRLIGVDADVEGGAAEVDVMTGGAGCDHFVAGDAARAYYVDADEAVSGETSHVVVTDFEAAEDVLELFGTAADYRLDFFRDAAGVQSAAVIHGASSKPYGDLTAVIGDVALDLRLDDPAFSFVGDATGPAVPSPVAPADGAAQPPQGLGTDAAASVQSTIPLPAEFQDGTGYRWDIQGDGSISDGTNDAFDGGLSLSGFPGFDAAEGEDGDRELAIGPAPVDGIELTRKVFVPEDQGWARFLEIVTNTGSESVTYSVAVTTNLGSDGDTQLVRTSSGDQSFDASDQWLITDDYDEGGDPTVTHVIAGEGALAATSASLDGDNVAFTYDLELAPGETQIVMHFAAQSPNQATALAVAPTIATLEADVLAGLSQAEIAQTVNFDLVEPLPIVGTDADDVLNGTNRRDVIEGLGGDDVIQGLGGSDRLLGGTGNDAVLAGNGDDEADGGDGDDLISGDAGDDTLTGSAGDDELLAGEGDDSIDGGSDDDRLFGDSGSDLLLAGEGDDKAYGGDGVDSVDGGGGNDQLFGDGGDDRMVGGEGDDSAVGGSGNDVVDGGAGADRLTGADVALGAGQGEHDTLIGGTGADVFVLGDRGTVYYEDGDPLAPGEDDLAFILDFDSNEDVIELHGSEDLYELHFYEGEGGQLNAALLYDTDEARGDLIGIVANVSGDLTLAGPSFEYL